MLVPSALDPSIYTLAKAERASGRHNGNPVVITVVPRQSHRLIAQCRNTTRPTGLPVSILLSMETTEPCIFGPVGDAGARKLRVRVGRNTAQVHGAQRGNPLCLPIKSTASLKKKMILMLLQETHYVLTSFNKIENYTQG